MKITEIIIKEQKEAVALAKKYKDKTIYIDLWKSPSNVEEHNKYTFSVSVIRSKYSKLFNDKNISHIEIAYSDEEDVNWASIYLSNGMKIKFYELLVNNEEIKITIDKLLGENNE